MTFCEIFVMGKRQGKTTIKKLLHTAVIQQKLIVYVFKELLEFIIIITFLVFQKNNFLIQLSIKILHLHLHLYL